MTFLIHLIACSGKSESNDLYYDTANSDTSDTISDSDTTDTYDTNSSSNYSHAIVTTADYANGLGALAVIGLETQTVNDNLIQNIHSDALTVVEESLIFQINRLGVDSIRIYEWANWNAPLTEWSTGDNSNPQQVAKCFDTVVTSLFAKDYLAIYNLNGIIQGQIDLSAFVPAGDTDGSPEASSIIRIGNSAYVALQQLDMDGGGPSVQSTGPGMVLEVDCESLSVLNTFEVGPNPRLSAVGNNIIMRTGILGNFDGGIRRLDTQSNELAAYTIYDLDYGVWFSGIAGTTDGQIGVNGFDPVTYESVFLCGDDNGLVEIERSSSSYFSHIINNDQSEFWLSTDQGIRIFDSESCSELTETPIQTTLNPSHVSFY
ncbi:MAG: hypothetical protein ACON4U_21630 [Myxococcota bacterium]